MKLYVQFSTNPALAEFEVDSVRFHELPKRQGSTTIDDRLGYITMVHIQGNTFVGWDHYAAVPDGEDVILYLWNDEGRWATNDDRHGMVIRFPPLTYDPALGLMRPNPTWIGYAQGARLSRMQSQPVVERVGLFDWVDWRDPLAVATRHGVQMSDTLYGAHKALWEKRRWEDWLPAPILVE